MSITLHDFVTQSSCLAFHFIDYTSDCGALTLRLSQLVSNRFVTVKLKGPSEVLLMKMKPSSPKVTRHKEYEHKTVWRSLEVEGYYTQPSVLQFH